MRGRGHGVASAQAEVGPLRCRLNPKHRQYRSTRRYRFAVDAGLELEAMAAELVLELEAAELVQELEVAELVHSAVSYESCLDR